MENHGPGDEPHPDLRTSGWGATVLRTANRLEPSGDIRGVVYGTVVSGSVLAIASRHTESAERLGLEVLSTLVVYWLAHVYCQVLWERYTHGIRLRASEIGRALVHEIGILKGGVAPIAVMFVARLAGAEFGAAVWIGLWTTVLLLFLTGIVAGLRSGARGTELGVDALIGGLFGLVLVLFKAGLH
jgi:hypothetical protein